MVSSYKLYIVLFFFLLTNFDFASAQTKQYKSYMNVSEGSYLEPDTTFQVSKIILDLKRDRIALIVPKETLIYDILLVMEHKDDYGVYTKTFEVQGRSAQVRFRFSFIRQGKDSEATQIIFEAPTFGDIETTYYLE